MQNVHCGPWKPIHSTPKARRATLLRLGLAFGLLLALGLRPARAGEPVVIYDTGFEFSEGYRTEFTLTGQNSWIGSGTGGNGIVTNFFDGGGQQAYIGAFAPTEEEEFFNVWRPVDLAPIDPALPMITFSVRMQIEDSIPPAPRDDFRWSVYNTAGARLFTLDFDTSSLEISYYLDDGDGFVSTGYAFETGGPYDLVVAMNFLRNRWSAWLNETSIAAGLPITTTGAALNLGDVDAVWAIRDPALPGDNFMVFDDYRITADEAPAFRPYLEVLGFIPNRGFTIRLHGEPDQSYAIDASTDLDLWTPIKTNAAPDGVFDLVDTEAEFFDRQTYRARLWER